MSSKSKTDGGLEELEKTLELMRLQEAGVLARIGKEKGKKARKEGKAYARLKDIPAKEGHIHKFRVEIAEIEEGYSRYYCSDDSCRESGYKCNNCGYVPGHPREERFNNVRELAGAAGIEYSCHNCGKELGNLVLERS